MIPNPRLSCEQCKKRKTKCDKTSPCCSACKAADLRCEVVQRARLPRGRTGKKKKKSKEELLETRVKRIEELLTTRQRKNGKVSSDCDDGLVAPEFWGLLASEISGIREVIHDSEDEEEEEGENPPLTNEGLIAGLGFVAIQNDVGPTLSTQTRDRLMDLYRSRVDVLFKVLHWPSTVSDIRRLNADDRPSMELFSPHRAREYSIYFMAACSVTDDECRSIFGCGKAELVQRCRGATEVQLSRCMLIQRPSVVGLQAFVIYLNAFRTCGYYATSWTLLAVAVRLATALSLGKENPTSTSLRDLEVRRRLWYCINMMDTQAMLDRGSVLLVSAKSLGPPPRNVSDDDLDGALRLKSSQETTFNDMTFSVMIYEAMACQKRLCEPPAELRDIEQRWEWNQECFKALQKSFQEKYLTISDVASPLEVFTKQSAGIILASMQLLLRRPPYRQEEAAVPQWDDFDSMKVSTEILERHRIQKSADEFKMWAWKRWPPWYALAVTLAELCRRPVGGKADRAFAVAVGFFDAFSPSDDDLESGPLWGPIKKLLRRVHRLRESRDRAGTDSSLTTPSLQPPTPKEGPTVYAPTSQGELMQDYSLENNQVLQMSCDHLHSWMENEASFGFVQDAMLQMDDLFPDLGMENGGSWMTWNAYANPMEL